jgi:carboxyl-terminal processing protease
LKGKDEIKGEAGIKGHIKVNEEEQGGSSGYVPPDPLKDKQRIWAANFLRGTVSKANPGEGVTVSVKSAKPDAKAAASKAPALKAPAGAPESQKN